MAQPIAWNDRCPSLIACRTAGASAGMSPSCASSTVVVGRGCAARYTASAVMTLTLRALLDARIVFLLFKGVGKLTAFETALADGPIEEMPIRAVLRQKRVPVQVYWTPGG